ncbi:hypothetical protein CTAYLR_002552 [Chrysophaeum taylorii]|uniref:Acyl-CoA oxidase n=1 Tax=Chrysophaeum taylorii TaxID=2483200 RepID=A0AAD7UFN0_9STRA|nr:hypothetical protein CTAYLR_002552 [Chrysophaeum taylorii]
MARRNARVLLFQEGRRRLGMAAVARADSGAAWESEFLRVTSKVSGDASHAESAASMRELVQSGVVKHTDIRERPERFFKAHRLLARHAVREGPGFWIRFTVHYNLCLGTVLAVGSPKQIEALDADEQAGKLGCFALTETLAGVQSGLVVQTTADFVGDGFVIHTPSPGAEKRWISQGHVADRAVVVADLRVDGKRKGPHAFYVGMRENGSLSPGIQVGDMGLKTTGNDLDNAWIRFDHLKVPTEALLSRYCEVTRDGGYALTDAVDPFAMIGQRLYTGRVAVAQAALAYSRELFKVTKEYADSKPIPRGAGTVPLSSLPQLRALFKQADDAISHLERFVGACEDALVPLMRDSLTPSPSLANAIATAKVRAVEAAIDLCWRLKNDVGSYALMADSGFKHLDFVSCCKFAEGDSRILMQKMARDQMRLHANGSIHADPIVVDASARLADALAPAKGNKQLQADLWDENYALVYALADALMDATMRDVLANAT